MGGVLLCIDCFLSTLVCLPLRFARACFKLMGNLQNGRVSLGREHVSDLFYVFVILTSFLLINHINISFIYHFIRSQRTFEFYVFFGILQICDKLCSSFGLDITETCREHIPRFGPLRALVDFMLCSVYVCFHAVILFAHVVTLNVAINAQDQSLLKILIMNNVSELKGSAFMMFSKIKPRLFQVVAADIVERFQLLIFLAMIFIQNLTDLNWEYNSEWLQGALQTSLLFLGIECLVDWVKHGFISKHNHLRPAVYAQYTELLTGDVISYRAQGTCLGCKNDAPMTIPRRLGFLSMPYVCLCFGLFQSLLSTSLT
eukprot:TRINITY_DN2919_c0_g1_i1.p1 TRINITY_DN2919_c0_g1~~TRINITY_DN2919_c0_g1_i1.p1  ORF type:complete len:334 (-),score=82.21 TRINITY_DN2919_c0_g1_i1:199-1143(-)